MDLCFAADRTLGKLARWLRILGFDTLYESDISTRWFYEHLGQDRILLTRTEKIREAFAASRLVFVNSDQPVKQLRQVIVETGITEDDIHLFSRCIRCNIPIAPIDKEDIFGLVPDYTWETHSDFQTCHRCERIYWKGSHWQRSRERAQQLFSDSETLTSGGGTRRGRLKGRTSNIERPTSNDE